MDAHSWPLRSPRGMKSPARLCGDRRGLAGAEGARQGRRTLLRPQARLSRGREGAAGVPSRARPWSRCGAAPAAAPAGPVSIHRGSRSLRQGPAAVNGSLLLPGAQRPYPHMPGNTVRYSSFQAHERGEQSRSSQPFLILPLFLSSPRIPLPSFFFPSSSQPLSPSTF